MAVQGARRALFELGSIVATPRALKALAEAGVQAGELILRHVSGSFGNLSEEDIKANKRAVKNGDGRVFSAYKLETGERCWIITEADRSSTCLLLPSEY